MMEQGFENAPKLIVLLSEDYQKSEYCRKEYNTYLLGDPGNLKQRVIVFRVSDCVAPAISPRSLPPILCRCSPTAKRCAGRCASSSASTNARREAAFAKVYSAGGSKSCTRTSAR